MLCRQRSLPRSRNVHKLKFVAHTKLSRRFISATGFESIGAGATLSAAANDLRKAIHDAEDVPGMLEQDRNRVKDGLRLAKETPIQVLFLATAWVGFLEIRVIRIASSAHSNPPPRTDLLLAPRQRFCTDILSQRLGQSSTSSSEPNSSALTILYDVRT